MSTAKSDLRLGFIGAGMMATAMINGVIASKVAKAGNIIASDLSQPNLDRLGATGVQTTKYNEEVLRSGVDVLVLAVKPGVIPTVLSELAREQARSKELVDQTLVVSIAAGVPLSAMEPLLQPRSRVVRVMPNTPCLVSEAASAYAPGSMATEGDKAMVGRLLGAVGYSCEVKEDQLDAVTGVSGSGPAYIYMLIEALADGGVRMGLPRDVAMKLAAQTARGAATMVLETGSHPGQLKDQVCSPGGTTIAAVETLEKSGFRAAALGAVVVATRRSMELKEAALKKK
ncbi:unnamed protein product [Discosporangium mesarthrocarpum]